MLFNSFGFLFFFFVVLFLLKIENYTTKNIVIRNSILLISSYVFYGWFNISFLFILLFVTIINYITGYIILNSKRYNKIVLGVGTTLSLLPLLFYKYLSFILQNIQALLGNGIVVELNSNIIMPIGISFFTFQALTYSIDIYRGKIAQKYSLPDFMLFVSFFPTVLSGPIEKARNLLPQIQKYNTISLCNFMQGAQYFIWGLFKKIVIADRLSQYIDWVYNSVEYQNGSTLALTAILYSIQIYCDFSGYSDMALGVAKGLGFNITQNFRFPYFATSIKEFWHRWHISLTSWFTEYVYFSLGGNRVRLKARWIFNISMVFLLSGIWHGASWNFLLWGLLHSVYYIIEYAFGIQNKDYKIKSFLRIPACAIVFILVTFAWIFFRIEDFSTAIYILNKIFTDFTSPIAVGASTFTFACNMMLVIIFILLDWILYKRISFNENKLAQPTAINILYLVAILLMITLFGVSADNFVYFQF